MVDHGYFLIETISLDPRIDGTPRKTLSAPGIPAQTEDRVERTTVQSPPIGSPSKHFPRIGLASKHFFASGYRRNILKNVSPVYHVSTSECFDGNHMVTGTTSGYRRNICAPIGLPSKHSPQIGVPSQHFLKKGYRRNISVYMLCSSCPPPRGADSTIPGITYIR